MYEQRKEETAPAAEESTATDATSSGPACTLETACMNFIENTFPALGLERIDVKHLIHGRHAATRQFHFSVALLSFLSKNKVLVDGETALYKYRVGESSIDLKGSPSTLVNEIVSCPKLLKTFFYLAAGRFLGRIGVTATGPGEEGWSYTSGKRTFRFREQEGAHVDPLNGIIFCKRAAEKLASIIAADAELGTDYAKFAYALGERNNYSDELGHFILDGKLGEISKEHAWMMMALTQTISGVEGSRLVQHRNPIKTHLSPLFACDGIVREDGLRSLQRFFLLHNKQIIADQGFSIVAVGGPLMHEGMVCDKYSASMAAFMRKSQYESNHVALDPAVLLRRAHSILGAVPRFGRRPVRLKREALSKDLLSERTELLEECKSNAPSIQARNKSNETWRNEVEPQLDAFLHSLASMSPKEKKEQMSLFLECFIALKCGGALTTGRRAAAEQMRSQFDGSEAPSPLHLGMFQSVDPALRQIFEAASTVNESLSQ